MSKNLLPTKGKQYLKNASKKLSNDDIDEQNHILKTNETSKKIRNHKRTSIYDDTLTQVSNNMNDYYNSKLDYLNEHKKLYVNEHNEDALYDPQIEFSKSIGEIENNIITYKTYYINIDSRYRQKEKVFVLDTTYYLQNKPFILTKDSTKLFIKQPIHPFNQGDKIMIKGLSPITKQYMYDPLNVNTKYNNILFVEGFDYALIKETHNINKTSDLNFFCSISNFTNPPDNEYCGNIPLSFINSVHQIILSIDSDVIFTDNKDNMTELNTYTTDYNPNYFFIKLPYPFQYLNNTSNAISTQTRGFNIVYYYYYNIPIYYFNAQNPVSIYNKNEYYIISDITNNGYYIDLGIYPYWNTEENEQVFGGNNILVNKINNIKYSWPESNNYTIPMKQ